MDLSMVEFLHVKLDQVERFFSLDGSMPDRIAGNLQEALAYIRGES